MLGKLGSHLRQNVVAYLALFVALGGTSAYATHEMIDGSDVVDASLTGVDILNQSVTGADLALESFGTSRIRNNNILSEDIRDGTLTAADLADGAVANAKLADDAVTSGKVLDNNLQGTDLLDNTVTSADVMDGTLTAGDLADGAITPAKFGTIPAARVQKTSDQAVSPSVPTTLTFDTESFDTAGLHDNVTDNSRLTAPVAGVYQVSAGVSWGDAGGGSPGNRELAIRKNGSELVSDSTHAGAPSFVTAQSTSTLVNLAAGDFVEARVQQTGGAGGLNATTHASTNLTMAWIAPG